MNNSFLILCNNATLYCDVCYIHEASMYGKDLIIQEVKCAVSVMHDWYFPPTLTLN